MYAQAALAQAAYAESVDLGVPITPEVTVEGKTLILVVELTTLQPAET